MDAALLVWLQIAVPGLVAGVVSGAVSIGSFFWLEPKRERNLRFRLLIEKRLAAQQKLVAALTRLDHATIEYEDAAPDITDPPASVVARCGEAFNDSLLQLSEARLLLSDQQFSATDRFLQEWALERPPGAKHPRASAVIFDHFGAEFAMLASFEQPQRFTTRGKIPVRTKSDD